MTRRFDKLVASAGAVLLFVAFSIYADSAFDWESAVGICSVPVKSVTPSLDGKLSVVIFEVYCGPLPSANTHASLVGTGQVFSRKRNPSFLILGGSYNLSVRWISESSLDIELPATAKLFRSEQKMEQIEVAYRYAL